MDLLAASSGRLTVLVRSALGVLVVLFALTALDCGSVRAGTPTDTLANPAPDSAASLVVAWKAVRPRHAGSFRSQTGAVPFPSHSYSGKVGIVSAAISIGWLPAV